MECFLRTIFGDALADDRRLGVFTLPDCQTRHFTSLEAAALWAAEEAKAKDVYFGVGLAGGNFGRRNSAADVVAIGALWADIDLAAPYRIGKALPENMGQAREMLARLPIQPSLVVDSGHGLHAYWVFKEPWILESDAERELAARIARGWHGQVCRGAAAFGWKLENLGDLARVLRLPGTFNRKGPKPAEVRILEEDLARRYNPEDFEAFEAAAASVRESQAGGFALHPEAEPPAAKISALVVASPVFLKTWDRRREDLADQSQSAYDQSLANIAALDGWSGQEIANLLIAARRRHGEKPEKALRPDYMASTVAKAMAAAAERVGTGVDLSGFQMKPSVGPKTLGQLVRAYPALRPPVIEGLLREGETLNIISAPKIGKSWLATDLALAVATGGEWMGMPCVKGKVLILDNELHAETSAHRIPKVAAARGIPFEAVADMIHIENLRGRLKDLPSLQSYFEAINPETYKFVILDAFYRFLPMKSDENDNGTMAGLYNLVDAFAEHLKSSFALIHHTSKGSQSLKDVTDVGAGAGAQARATDTHLILRRHEEEDAVVLDAAVRSWPPLPPRCLRWTFPVWQTADDLDPAKLRQEGKRRAKAEGEVNEEESPGWTPRGFVDAFIGAEPKVRDAILADANERGLSDYKAGGLLRKAEAAGLAFRWDMGHGRFAFAIGPRPEGEVEEPSKRQDVEGLLRAEPGLSNADAAQRCGVSDRYVRRIRTEMEGHSDAS